MHDTSADDARESCRDMISYYITARAFEITFGKTLRLMAEYHYATPEMA